MTSNLRVDLRLYKDTDRVLSATKRLRQRLVALVQERSASEWTSGKLRVWYNKPEDMWNEGSFTTIEELKQLLADFYTEAPDFINAKGAVQAPLN